MNELQANGTDQEQKAATIVQKAVTKSHFSFEESMHGPPLLDKVNNGIEGLAFIGLSLSRYTNGVFSNDNSISRQTQFDFDLLQDREYKYFCSTNDDGWLVGEIKKFSVNFNSEKKSVFNLFYK
jgi:hypothetical protein